jgi:hypothetical protein
MSNAIVHNAGVNYTLYYNLINWFKNIMDEHPSILQVSYGNIEVLDDNEYPRYPMGNISVLGTTFTENESRFNVQLIIADKGKNKNNQSEGERNNQVIPFYGVNDVVDIQSNTLGILNDLTDYTQRSIVGFEINDNITCQPFADEFNNGLAGWVSTFTLTTHNDKNRCLFELY